MSFSVVIPARYASTRLPGKALLDIAGKPMLQHVYERVQQSHADQVVIATDDARIQEAAEGFGATVCMTAEDHPSGTDRIQEVANKLGFSDDQVVVNVQGDEPLIHPESINQVAELLLSSDAAMATLAKPITDPNQVFDPNVVKAVGDGQGHALYFSRAPIPWARETFGPMGEIPKQLPTVGNYLQHIGIYAYRVSLLNDFVTWPPAPLEITECLEQLRVLWHGERIKLAVALHNPGPGVDTPEDLEAVRKLIAANQPSLH